MSEQANNVNINVEQILAAILSKVGEVSITAEELLKDYSQFAVAIDPGEEGQVVFKLMDLEGVDLDEVVE